MKRMGLAAKTALSFLVVILAVMATAAYVFTGRIERALARGLQEKAELVASSLEPYMQRVLVTSTPDLADLQRSVRKVRDAEPSVLGIRLENRSGQPLVGAGEVEGPGLVVARDVEIGGISYGRLTIRFSRSAVEREIKASFVRSLQLTVFLCALGLLAAVFLAKRTARPMEELAAAAERVAEGDLSTRVAVTRSDEIGVVQREFNEMVETLARSRAALERRLAEMSALYEVARILHTSGDHEEVLNLAFTAAEAGFGFDRIAVFLATGNGWDLAAARGIDPEALRAEAAKCDRFEGWAETKHVSSEELPPSWGLPEAIVAPLTAAGRRVGLLIAHGENLKEENTLRLAAVFGSQLAPALHSALVDRTLVEKVDDPFSALVRRIGNEAEKAVEFGLPFALVGLRIEGAADLAKREGAGALDGRLAELIEKARAGFPDAAFVARYGGDRLVVALPGASRRDAERAVLAFEAPSDVTANVAAVPDDGETAVELLLRL